MPNPYKNGAFALGLIVGIGIALNLFLWLDYKAQYKGNQTPSGYSNNGGNQVGNTWERIIGTFVSPSDTLAQWIMAVFTVAVVILVWRTLIATQRMAFDTRHIGEAQVRAYLSVEVENVPALEGAPPDAPVFFRVKLTNNGQSPARDVVYSVKTGLQPKKLPSPCPDMIKVIDGSGFSISAGDTGGAEFPSTISFADLMRNYDDADRVPHITVVVNFSDVFENRWKQRFAAQITPIIFTDRFPEIGDGVSIGFRMTTASEHNDEKKC